MQTLRWWMFIFLTLILTALLVLCPLPDFLRWYRPQWFMLWIIFCQLQFPRQFNPWHAWGAGLMADALLGSLLGMHALIYTLIAYVTALLRSRFLSRPFWQQIGKILILIGLGQIVILWFHVLAGQNPHTLMIWMGVLSSGLVWPIWVGLLSFFSRIMGTAPYLVRHVI